MRKLNITETILSILEGQAEATADLFDSYFCSRNESYRKLRGKLLGTIPRTKFSKYWAEIYSERNKFYKTLSALKKAGLISKSENTGKSMWSITGNGKNKLTSMIQNFTDITPSKFPTIVSYDIPNRYTRDRNWLRLVLLKLGFSAAHKSLLIGNFKIPEALLVELRKRKILEYVHILEINNTGTFNLK